LKPSIVIINNWNPLGGNKNKKNSKMETVDEGGSGSGSEVTERFAAIDHSRQRYPYCIVWSPLPPITWLFPFIGHTGIGDSEGIIYDFAGPYSIGRAHF
jgi:hypothetical protein